jgi:hypothetical protein
MDVNGESKGVAVHGAKPSQHIDTPKRLAAMAYLTMYNAANRRPDAVAIVQQFTL